MLWYNNGKIIYYQHTVRFPRKKNHHMIWVPHYCSCGLLLTQYSLFQRFFYSCVLSQHDRIIWKKKSKSFILIHISTLSLCSMLFHSKTHRVISKQLTCCILYSSSEFCANYLKNSSRIVKEFLLPKGYGIGILQYLGKNNNQNWVCKTRCFFSNNLTCF